jgi:hypothetical protein
LSRLSTAEREKRLFFFLLSCVGEREPIVVQGRRTDCLHREGRVLKKERKKNLIQIDHCNVISLVESNPELSIEVSNLIEIIQTDNFCCCIKQQLQVEEGQKNNNNKKIKEKLSC